MVVKNNLLFIVSLTVMCAIQASSDIQFEEETVVVASPGIKPHSLVVTIPHIGSVEMMPVLEPHPGLMAYLPSISKNIALGPLEFSEGKMLLIDGTFSYVLQGILFGKKFHAGIKELETESKLIEGKPFNVSKMKLGITFSESVFLEIIPGVLCALNSVNIDLEQDKPVIVSADTEIGKIQTKISISIEKNKYTVALSVPSVFMSTLIPPLTLTPLAKVKLSSSVLSFSLNNAQKISEAEVKIKAQVDFFGASVGGQVNFRHDQAGNSIIVFEAFLPADKTIAQVIPPLKNTLFEDVICKDVRVVISTADYSDTQRQLLFKHGINLYGDVTLKGLLSPINHIIHGSENAHLRMMLSVPLDPLKSVLTVQIPVNISFKKDQLLLDSLLLQIGGIPPKATLKGAITVKPTPKDESIVGTAKIDVSDETAVISGTMQGRWNDPLGIKNISLKDVAVEAGINYKVFFESGLPDSFGMAATLSIGKKSVSLAGNFSATNSEDIMLAGKLNELSLKDLIDLGFDMFGRRIDDKNIPVVEMNDLTVYLVQKDVTIGELTFSPGLNIAATMKIFDIVAEGQCSISQTGIIARGVCTPIIWGPLRITGTDRAKNKNAGPTLIINLPMPPRLNGEIYLDGLLELGDVFHSKAQLHMSLHEFYFNTEGKINNLYSASIKGVAPFSRNPNFTLTIDFKQEFTSFLQNTIDGVLNDMEQSAHRRLDAAKNELVILKEAADDVAKSIENKQKNFARSTDSDDEKTSADLRNKIGALEKQWDGFSVAEKISHAVDIGAQIVALKALLEKQEITKSLTEVPTKIDIAAKTIERESLLGAQKASDAFLTALQDAAQVGKKVGGYAVSSFMGLIRVDHVRFKGDARKIVHGVMPSLTIEFTDIFKRKHSIKVSFDFKNPIESAQKIAKNMINFVIGRS
ncbi:MAG: hypothetical protein WC707_03540 [Candidatus Babeliaceae bacterium]